VTSRVCILVFDHSVVLNPALYSFQFEQVCRFAYRFIE